MEINDITYKIRGAIFAVYNALGPGLLESVYELALMHELSKQGLNVKRQVKIDVYYDNVLLETDFRLDILVEDSVIIELKSVEMIKDVHHKQLLSYMRLAKKPVGILVNFNTNSIADSIFRKVL
jgi:GxxExxY protein